MIRKLYATTMIVTTIYTLIFHGLTQAFWVFLAFGFWAFVVGGIWELVKPRPQEPMEIVIFDKSSDPTRPGPEDDEHPLIVIPKGHYRRHYKGGKRG